MRKSKHIYGFLQLISLSILFFVMISILACDSKMEESLEVSMVESESFFLDFTIDDNKVFMKCWIKLKNTSDEDKNIRLYAQSKQDVAHGLLKNPEMFALDENGDFRIFTIPANLQVTFYDVEFVGEYGGRPEKVNRLLPKIIIEIVGEETGVGRLLQNSKTLANRLKKWYNIGEENDWGRVWYGLCARG